MSATGERRMATGEPRGAPGSAPRLSGPIAAAAAVAALAALGALAACAYVQAGHWRNSQALFTHALEVTGPNAPAQNTLAFDFYERGLTEEAIAHDREALRIWPGYLDAHVNLAAAL